VIAPRRLRPAVHQEPPTRPACSQFFHRKGLLTKCAMMRFGCVHKELGATEVSAADVLHLLGNRVDD
jgi:hypothetical protein